MTLEDRAAYRVPVSVTLDATIGAGYALREHSLRVRGEEGSTYLSLRPGPNWIWPSDIERLGTRRGLSTWKCCMKKSAKGVWSVVASVLRFIHWLREPRFQLTYPGACRGWDYVPG